MNPMSRVRRDLRVRFGWMILAAAVVAAGCSTSNSNGAGGSVNHINAQGTSVSGWLAASGASNHSRSATNSFIALGNAGGCTECHGADLLGGISRVSCMNNPSACHHTPIDNWVVSPAGAAAQQHGASAKRGPGSSSMYACQICHGTDFRTGRGGATCYTCHTLAPHPNRPWRSGGVDNTHVNVNTANAPVCYGCHAGGANTTPPHPPPSPAAPGTAPGCFNGTMCHNQASAPHITGSAWLNAGTGFHGTDAKADLTFCQGCHSAAGTINFNGGSAPTSCSASCHTAAKAHPTDWQGLRTINGVTVSHRTSGNRDVACAICHKTTGAGAGPNPSAPSCFSASFTNASGQARACHPGGPGAAPHALGAAWLDPATGGSSFHGTTAKADLLFCQTCHGTPPRSFGGGTGATTVCTTCHTTAEAHPTDWQGVRTISTASISHRTSGNRTAACGICHKVDAAGAGPNPSAPSCFSANHTNGAGQTRPCHSGGPGAPSHPVPFIDNTTHTRATAITFASDCLTCHDPSGASTKSGPVCTTCHISDPRGVTDCSSCHVNPPNGTTTAYPNVEGAHTEHLALHNTTTPGTPVTCSTCHNGLGTGTLSHYERTRPTRTSPASVAFVTTYNAKTGASGFDNSSLLRCTNVSCHGGQATPNWRTGSITVATQCTSCHASGTAQFNSQNSGEHSRHSGGSFACTECHDMNVATNNKPGVVNHLKFLGTSVMEGPAKDTFRNSTGTVVYTPGATAGTGSCTGTCHTQGHSGEIW
ncbi:MAG: CxxxxCH/CxxCH domain-containing protein [bacterium]|nr:CxxxxCH/CxxCH domain-containing protein [bacterium]